jgi:hypothetical protein
MSAMPGVSFLKSQKGVITKGTKRHKRHKKEQKEEGV